ncbi:hypothetical protein N9917_00335 [Deltaproteobacteria bacterium]|nr:hypothetical protein [Deltaproteobacteria bacterium]
MNTRYPAPHSIGPEREVTLTGMLMPWRKNGQPAFLHLHGVSPDVFHIVLFADEDSLRSVLGRAGVSFDSIKLIEDGPDFLDSIPTDIQIIANLRFTEEGKVRYTEIRR